MSCDILYQTLTWTNVYTTLPLSRITSIINYLLDMVNVIRIPSSCCNDAIYLLEGTFHNNH